MSFPMSLFWRGPWVPILLLAAAACSSEPPADTGRTAPAMTPSEAVEELLEADRAFARAAAGTDLVSALTAMFTSDVRMPAAGIGIATGIAQATAALDADSANRASRVEWVPVRGGISADGTHGFTFGYVTTLRPDSTRAPGKYLSYWVKGASGWKVAAYKRGRRADEVVDMSVQAPSLPAAMTAPSVGEAALSAHRESLAAAERAFSDEAQTIGLSAAFARFGRPDAVNMGGPSAAWVVGADNIGAAVGGGNDGPTPVSWGPDRGVLVASSGDLGVTFGMILPNTPQQGAPPDGYPFFTIWRRSGPNEPWLYIAE